MAVDVANCVTMLTLAHSLGTAALKVQPSSQCCLALSVPTDISLRLVLGLANPNRLSRDRTRRKQAFATNTIKECWDEIPGVQFAELEAALLYELIKEKTRYPLHRAIMLSREDVIFLYLLEHDHDLSQRIDEVRS